MKKSEGKFRTITLRTDVYEEFEKLRAQEQTTTGLAELSWTNFVALLMPRIRGQQRARTGLRGG